jgi:hypothetical protein
MIEMSYFNSLKVLIKRNDRSLPAVREVNIGKVDIRASIIAGRLQ